MSVYYYIACDDHQAAVFIGSNTGTVADPEEWKAFYLDHLCGGYCKAIKVYDEFALPSHYDIIGDDK